MNRSSKQHLLIIHTEHQVNRIDNKDIVSQGKLQLMNRIGRVKNVKQKALLRHSKEALKKGLFSSMLKA